MNLYFVVFGSWLASLWLVRYSLGELVYFRKYKQKILDDEISELRNELSIIMETWPDDLHQGFFLSLEEQQEITDRWIAFGPKKEK